MASSSSSNNPSLNDTSYVDMSTSHRNPDHAGGEDPFLAGKHCQLEHCNQLDFLPFKCQSCGKIYCLDHRTEDSHKCAKAGAWAERKRQVLASHQSIGQHKPVRDRNYIPPGSTCAGNECKVEIGSSISTGVHCDACRQNYCLKHRLREEHDCAARVLEMRSKHEKLQDNVGNAMDNFKSRWMAWQARQKAKASGSSSKGFFGLKTRTSPAAERIKRMNELKKSAKGDQKLVADKRVYLVVLASEPNAKGKYPKEMVFYSKDWVVGRLLDAAVKEMKISDKKVEGQEPLQVFHVEAEKFLKLSEKIGAELKDGHRVVLTRGEVLPDDALATLMS